MIFTSFQIFTIASVFLIHCAASEVKCDLATQEICYDENFYPVSCANITDGGCDCPRGEVKCGAFKGYAGYCTPVCCDFLSEDTCYNETTSEPSFCAKISEGGCPCPTDQIRCGVSDFSIGYCTDVCCDWATEETCYNATAGTTTCVPIIEGGCNGCKNGQIKCGETAQNPGYCADICCDPLTEETCYDENLNARSCAPIEEGCPCPEGKSRCGAFEGFPGLCSSLCCDSLSEETCYDESWQPLYCAKFSDGGCPCPVNQTKCGANKFDPGYCADVCCDLVTEGKMNYRY
ncbi:hypothetical protein HJC23_009187 [Cyclotella cryptica]|uniref:Uncharacterized protein n=1 Tax=Cyclotella cryptica TaxID=29204 RepID=A0ABD3PKX3_9STRA